MITITSTKKLDAHLNMTPMIDCVFLLLIFFLLTTNFITEQGIAVKLPQARSTTQQKEEDITIFLDQHGRISIRGKELGFAQLFDELRLLIGNNQHQLVILKADREIILNKAVKVMDIAKSAGAERLCIATETE